MKMVLKYYRSSILVVLLLAAATCSYGQAAVAHVKAIPPPVNKNVGENNTVVNHPDILNNSMADNSIHGGKAPVALKRVAEINSHPIRIPVMPKSSTVPEGSDIIKKDREN
jgi:hypothetical protein